VHFPRELVDALRDEAPGAYKDIGAVMRAQRDLVKVVRRLRPVLAWKGA
jgi:tRNA-splicing ligase RtcB